MSKLTAGLTPFAPDEIDRLRGQQGSEFVQGVRSGTASMRSSLNNALGAVGNAVGATDFAADRYAAADELAADAANAAPRVSSWRDVNSLGDAGDYAAGVLGGLVPSAAVGVGAGLAAPASLGLAGAVGAGALAYTPFEAGDVVGRMRDSGQEVDLGQAALAGGGSALAQSLLPGLVAGKLAGRVGAGPGAAPVTLSSAGRSVVGGAALEGGAEAGGEAIKQLGSGKTLDTLDTDAAFDAAVAGAVGGGALGGVGAAGQAAQQRAGDVGQGLDAAKNAATGLLARAKGGAKAGMESAKEAGGQAADAAGAKLDDMDIPAKLQGLWDEASAKGRDVLKRIADNEDVVGDVKAFAGAQGDKLKALLQTDDDGRLARVKQAATDLLNEKLSPEDQAKLKDAAANLGNRANQAWVASKSVAIEAAKSARTGVQRFIDDTNAKRQVDKEVDKGGPKKSEVSAVRDTVMQAVVPQLLKARPELADMDPEQASAFSDALMTTVQDLADGKSLSSTSIAKMMDAVGPGAADVLDATQRAMGGLDETQRKTFYKALLEADAEQKTSGDITKLQRESLVPGLRDVMRDDELRTEAEMLRRWATSSRKMKDDPQAAFAEKRLRDGLATRYGDKADAILKAVEKSLPKIKTQLDANRVLADEEGNPIGEEGTDLTETDMEAPSMVYFGGGRKGEDMMLHPDYDDKDGKFAPASEQKLTKVKGSNPNIESRFVTAAEMGYDHPMVKKWRAELARRGDAAGIDGEAYADQEIDKYVAIAQERSTSPQKVSADELGAMRLDTHRYPNSPSRINVNDKLTLDAVKITKSMQARFKDEYTADDDKSKVIRMLRMFTEGVAAVQDNQGVAFEVGPDVVIGQVNGRRYTFAEAQEQARSVRRTKADKSKDAATQELVEQRKNYKKASPVERQNLRDMAEETVAKMDAERDAELTAEPDAPADIAGFGSETRDGYALNKPRMREIEAALSKLDTTTPAGMKREQELLAEFGRLNLDRAATTRAQNRNEDRDSGRTEVDPFGPTVDAMRGREEGPGVNINSDGSGRLDPGPLPPLQKVVEKLRASTSAPARALSTKLEALMALQREVVGGKITGMMEMKSSGPRVPGDVIKRRGTTVMTKQDIAMLDSVGGMTKPSEIAGVVNQLSSKYADELSALPDRSTPNPKAVAAKKAALSKEAASGDPALLQELSTSNDAKGLQRAVEHLSGAGPGLDAALAAESYGHLKTRAEVDSFLAAAKRRYAELQAEDRRVLNDDDHPTGRLPDTQQQALYTLEKMFGKDSRVDFESFYDGVDNTNAAIDAANARLAELIRSDESVGYGLQTKRYSAQAATGAAGPINRQEVYAYINRVLGPKIQIGWANIAHAGEFERIETPGAPTEDVIRLSVHSLNPMSAAYHESLHAFFAKLGDIKQGGVMDVVNRAASSASVMNQLSRLLANEPAALKQLNNAEERAAYMYQFWASGQLTIGPATQNVFQKIASFIRSVLGTWSNDQRALHILEYFHSGDFAKDSSSKPFLSDTVQQKLMAPGRNSALQQVKQATKPLLEFGESVAVAGGTRMRESGVPALADLANAMKLQTTEKGTDPGFLPASRAERARVMNGLGAKLKGMSEDSVAAALQSLQSKSNDAIKALPNQADRGNAYTAKAEIRKVLDGMFKYMTDAGVKVNDLGVGKDYFPRAYDTSFISSHQAEFKAVLAKHGVTNPERVVQKIMVADGAEFTTEVDKPGMQSLKPRILAHIPDAELAPFMRKSVYEIMSSYVTQATRRAEWARRFNDNGSGVTELLRRAEQEGATPDQLVAAQKFVRSVDGTLGDTISPEARRLMGNMIVYQNIRLLPLAVFSSVVDPMGVMVRGGTLSDSFATFKRGLREIPKGFKKDAKDDGMTQLAEAIGTIDAAVLTDATGALYSQGMVGDTGRKINDTFFKYNLMEQFGRSMRVGATEAALSFLARHADGKASPHSRRWLNELGLQPGQVQLDANGRPKLFESDGLTLEQSARMKAAVNRWVDGAVLRPDSVDKPLWMSDPHFALISHLKQFVFAFHETILKRVAHEYTNGNYAPAMALGSYVPIMIAADMVKGLIQGGGEEPEWKQNWTLGDYVASGIERAGLYGTGQFAVDMLQDVQRGGSGVGALLGPTVEQLTDAVGVLGGRGEFGAFALKSMPANALYAEAFDGGEEPSSSARVSE